MAVLQLISAIWAITAGLLSLILVGVAVTWDGRAFAVAALLVSFAPIVALFGNAAKRLRRRPAAKMMGAVALVLTLLLVWRAPSGKAPANANVRNQYPDGRRHFRFALGDLLPEVDQLMLGMTLVTFIDPLFTHEQSRRVKPLTAEIYRELERDPEFHALGSILPAAYDEVWGGDFDHGHSFLYIPSTYDRSKPGPALVFLHGSGGNFKAYLWLISRMADRLNVAVIAPTCGMGNWQRSDVEKLVNRAISSCSRHLRIDRDNLHAMGLSNGGLALSQLLHASSVTFQSYTFLSPVFDEARIQTFEVTNSARRPSLFILTGSRDDRVPAIYVRRMANQLSTRGASVAMQEIPGADHFALFSHREQMMRSVEAWLRLNHAGQ